jgi:serine phosphatase RsbU (regulator of sigma subunit)
MNLKGEEFRMDGVTRVIKAVGKGSPREIVEKLAAAVKLHAAGREPHDDLTVLVLGRKS